MKIDLYTACYNDAHMLGFFFRHYDPIVRRYVIYDDGSTDRSFEILRAHPKVEVRPPGLGRYPESFALSEIALFNECWKESRGSADWVLLVDIDEHLFHPQIFTYLEQCRSQGITIIPALGYQMVARQSPRPEQYLCHELTLGAPWVQMNKLALFSPNEVDEINFRLGKHSAEPSGNAVAPDRDELLLFHYKYLGIEETHRRHQEYAERLRPTDIINGWTARYQYSREELDRDWQNFESQLVDVSRSDLAPWKSHPAPRWWDHYRKGRIADKRVSVLESAQCRQPIASSRDGTEPLSREKIEHIVRLSEEIPGWTRGQQAAELARLSFELGKDAVILEIGSFLGSGAVLFAASRKMRGSGRVHCVDPFDCSGDAFSIPHYLSILEAAGGGDLRDLFDANIQRMELSAWVEVHQGTAERVAVDWKVPIDLLYLDGDQSCEGARAAYDAWAPFLKQGGIIAVHNTDPTNQIPGHDGNWHLVETTISAPRYTDIYRIGGTTFARKVY